MEEIKFDVIERVCEKQNFRELLLHIIKNSSGNRIKKMLEDIENNNKIPFQTGSIVQRLISHAASQRTISDYGYHMLVTVLQISGCHQTDPCRDRSRAVSRIKTVTVTFLSLGETTHTAIFPKLVKS